MTSRTATVLRQMREAIGRSALVLVAGDDLPAQNRATLRFAPMLVACQTPRIDSAIRP